MILYTAGRISNEQLEQLEELCGQSDWDLIELLDSQENARLIRAVLRCFSSYTKVILPYSFPETRAVVETLKENRDYAMYAAVGKLLLEGVEMAPGTEEVPQ